jgi:hypothetical protein
MHAGQCHIHAGLERTRPLTEAGVAKVCHPGFDRFNFHECSLIKQMNGIDGKSSIGTKGLNFLSH